MTEDFHKVWSKGDKCLAQYNGDKKYYPGCILKIVRSPDLRLTVQFDGYAKDEAETVDITQIKPVPKKVKQKPDVIIVSDENNGTLFKPLCGKEENKYLESKYKELSDDESDTSSSCSIINIPKRKDVVATGGKPVCRTSERGGKAKVSGIKTKERKNDEQKPVAKGKKKEEKTDVKGNESIYFEISQDTFDSQKPSTSKTALKYTNKLYYLSDSSDDLSEYTISTRKTVSKKSDYDDKKIKSINKPESEKCHDLSELSSHQSKTTSKNPDQSDNKTKVQTESKRCHRSSTDTTETEGESSDFKGEGFDDYDLEKPRFKFTPTAAKVPYKLSGPDDDPVIQVPATINQYLRDYQRRGIQFMYNHYSIGQGAILGDDMGLGKTVQVIGFIAALLRKHGNRLDMLKHKPKFIRQMSGNKNKLTDEDSVPQNPFLIIGPGSVLYNWIDELETWGYFTVGKYHGIDKGQVFAETKKGKYEVVVTTYETYRDNQEDLNSIKWTAVFVDEVHKIKGQHAQITQALKAISTRLRFGLTGTALQNDMLELWCILDWAQPNCLGEPEEFKFNYVDLIKQGQKIDATKRELADARKLKDKFSAIRNKMLLRRTKQLIADQLPTKDDNVVYCRLTPFQERVYKCLLDHPLMKTVMSMDQPCECGSGNITGICCNKLVEFKVSFREVMFTFLSLFMKVGNHVALLVPTDKTAEDNLKPLTKHILKEVYTKFPQYFSDSKEASFRTLSDPKFCGKMKVLKGLLSVFYKDHSKVLIFSYSTRVLDIFEQYLMTTEYEYRRIDGSTSMKKRMDLVREFNRDPNIFIFLISTKAGGLGLNLTGANRVVIFDPNWNPTHDLQAQDRAYRIGQRRNVKVYRLISSGTIEENMYLRQIYKQQLDSVAIGNQNANRYFKGIAGDRARQGELFGVKNMFQFRTGDQCLTLDILNENERVETELVGFSVSKYISNNTEENEENSEKSEEVVTTTDEDEVDGDMDRSLLDFFGITNEEDCNRNNSNNVNNSGKNGESQDSINNKTVTKSKQQANRKTPAKHSPKTTDLTKNRTSTPSLRKSSSSFSSVSDVFEQCGVVHIHKNRQLVGGSKAEDHMTKCAIQDVYELHQNSQIPAVYCEPLSESDDSLMNEPTPPPKPTRGKKGTKEDHNTPRSVVVGSNKILIGQTPKAIRLKHFGEMQNYFDETAAVDLAEQILSGSVQSRLSMLNDFYTKDKPEFTHLFTSNSENADKEKTIESRSGKTQRSTKRRDACPKRKKRRKENETLGISFLDFSDSESQNLGWTSRLDSVGSKTDSLDVGLPLRSTNLRKLHVSPKKKGKVNQSSKKKRTSENNVSGIDTVLTFDDNGDSDTCQVERGNPSDDFQTLINNIGEQEDTEVDKDNIGGDQLDISVLDDIFSSRGNSKQKRRKPPPKHKKLKVDNSVNDSLTETSATEEEEIPFGDTSTLKDDDIDVFSDPVKWKSRKRQQKQPVSIVDQMVSDAADEYDDLFKSGKMKKMKKSQESKPNSSEVSNFDPSASLF